MNASEPAHRRQGPRPQYQWVRRRPALGLGIAVATLGLIALFYVVAEHTGARNSDNATLVLQGQSMVHGNVLLSHWNLSEDSFWLLDVLFNAVGYVFVGVRPALLYAVPAVVAALVVLVGVLIARDNRKGAAAGAGAVAVTVVLAFPTHAMAAYFLAGGLHIVTALAALVAFYAMRRGRFGWGWVIAVVLLAAATLGDLQAVPYGTIPIALAGVVAAARMRSWRAAAAPVSAAAASVVLAVVVRLIADAIGTFSMASINPRAAFTQMIHNVVHIFGMVANLLGVRNNAYGTGGVPDWLQATRDLTAALIVICFALALIRLVVGALRGSAGQDSGPWWQSDPKGWRLDDMLVAACFGPAAMFVGLTLSSTNFSFLRYLTASVIFATVLTGRVVARWYSRTSLRRSIRSLRTGTAALATAVALLAAAGTGFTLAQPVPAQPAIQLIAFLKEHDLTRGIGDYWSASITTVQAKDQIVIRPVVAGSDGKLVPYTRESYDRWYDGTFQFVLTNATDATGDLNGTTIRASWGPAAHVYTVGTYTIRVWSHPISLQHER